jgi:hypothetical protein
MMSFVVSNSSRPAPPHHSECLAFQPEFRSSPCSFEVLPFNFYVDSPDQCESSFLHLGAAGVGESNQGRLSLCSPPELHHELQNVESLDQLEATHVNDPLSLLEQSNHSFVSGLPFSNPFHHGNELSYCFLSGMGVIESVPISDTKVGASLHEQVQNQQEHILRSRMSTDASSIELYFSKIVDGKKTKLSEMTEVLFDLTHTESQIIGGPTRPFVDLNAILPLPDELLAPSSSSGRSRISKLQHDVLNSWFFAHSDWP